MVRPLARHALFFVSYICFAIPCTADTITVLNAETLNQALVHAKGGDIILLAEGRYGDLALAGTDFLKPVVLRSRDKTKPAQFSNIILRATAQLTFDSIAVTRSLVIKDADHIRIINSHFSAEDSKPPENGYGIFILRCKVISLTDNVITALPRGIALSDSNTVDITGNELFYIGKQGINGVASHDIIITGNYFHDFTASPHLDMIQFWTANSIVGSHHITIRDNLFIQPKPAENLPMQGVAIAFTAQNALRYTHIVIQNNLINDYFGATLALAHLDQSQLLQNTDAFSPNAATSRWPQPSSLLRRR